MATTVQHHLTISTAKIKEHTKQPLQNMLSTTKQTAQRLALQIHTKTKGDKPNVTNTI